MSPLAFILGLIGLATSARVQWHGVPVMWLIAASVAGLILAAVLVLARSLLGDIRAGVIA